MPETTDKANTIRKSLERFGIKNPFLIAGILGVVSKETGFNLRSESSYSGTSNARLRTIFPSTLGKLSDAQLTTLKKDVVKFYDTIYGGKYGNTSPGDGYKYRGRGFNQITFKNAYKNIGDKIGVDLVTNPERLNEIVTASDSLAVFFVDAFKSGKASGYLKSKIGVEDISEIKDLPTAVKTAVQANAGWKTNFNNQIIQDGFKKALDIAPLFYPVTIPGAIPGAIVSAFIPNTPDKKKNYVIV